MTASWYFSIYNRLRQFVIVSFFLWNFYVECTSVHHLHIVNANERYAMLFREEIREGFKVADDHIGLEIFIDEEILCKVVNEVCRCRFQVKHECTELGHLRILIGKMKSLD